MAEVVKMSAVSKHGGMAKAELGKFNSAFQAFLRKNPMLEETFKIAKQNSQRGIWIVGGFVYRGLAHELYGGDVPAHDIDFIVEKRNETIVLPDGWASVYNKYGNLKFCSAEISMDFALLDSILSIKMRGVAPTIENYLTGVPLTVQSIAYDCNKQQIVGETGMKAIAEKTVAVNYLENAGHVAASRRVTVNEVIRTKAESLGFKPIYL